MPMTRSQAQRERQQQERRQGDPVIVASHKVLPSIESDVGPSEESAFSLNSKVFGHSGLVYDLRGLSPDAIPRAAIGFRSRFSVDDDRSRTFKDGVDSYHAIQLVGPVAIRIVNPASGYRKVECTCDTFQRNRSICTHVYWLYDNLNVALLDLSTSLTHVVTKENVLSSVTNLYMPIGKRIASKSLNGLIMTARADIQMDSDDDFLEEGRLDDNQDKVNQSIQDMLAVFDNQRLPEDFEDLARAVPRNLSSATAAIVPGDIFASLFGLARYDKDFRRLLRRALTRDFCARHLLMKLHSRAKEAFERLDDYTQFGPETRPQLVAHCADRVRQVVRQIGQYKDDRAPLDGPTKAKAAEILVSLLVEVCDRNKDIYGHMPWHKTAPDPEDLDDRNIYVNLISDPPIYEDSLEGQFFFLDVFSTFAPSEWMHLLDHLEVVSEQIKQYGAPVPFIERLEGLLAENQPRF